MICSMTGFGRTDAQVARECGFGAEISSVNRKQLELRFNLPREIAGLEPDLRKLVAEKVSRGAVGIRVYIEGAAAIAGNSLKINQSFLDELVQQALRTQIKFRLPESSLSIASLFALPGVIALSEPDAENPELKHRLARAVDDALTRFISMRREEGSILAVDLEARLALLEGYLNKIIPYTAQIRESLRKKLMDKLKSENIPVAINDERLLKEVLFYADKSDVTEEITRIRSHFAQFHAFLAPDAEEGGRSMDFLIQELFREITTLGNKAGSCEVTPLVVSFKTELEKCREQIQNVE